MRSLVPTYVLSAVMSLKLAISQRSPPTQSLVLPIPMINGSTPLIETIQEDRLALDAAYITEPNATSYEWWYFDAVSSDATASVTFQPYIEYTEDGPETILLLTLSYPNKTWTYIPIPQDKIYFSTIGQGSTGIASDGSFSWRSALDLSEYTISLNLELHGVTGEVHMLSIAPPHVKCGSAVDGASLADAGNILWVNPVPDAVAVVDIKVNGTSMAFVGSGYHDKNWGSNPFADGLNQWVWGHGRSGPYSVVWFWIIQSDDTIVASINIVRQGQSVFSTCDPDVLIIRPFDANGRIVYPVPYNTTATLEGIFINVDAGSSIGKFAFTARQSHIVQRRGEPTTYRRWIGDFSGGLQGDGNANSTGYALWEQMGPFA